MGFLLIVYETCSTFLLVHESRTEPTCELHTLALLHGVDGTEESGNSEASILPDKNSNSWILAKE